MERRLSDVLDEAVTQGIITPSQRDGIHDVARARTRGPKSTSGDFLAWAREAPRGFNAITIAYGVGALAVVFALGWFLADRWQALGAAGVLITSLVYGGVFGAAARVFTREKFPTAHGVAILLVIATVPLVVWALLRTTGIWAEDTQGICSDLDATFLDCRVQPVVLAASALVAVLASTRWLRFGPLMIPGAAALLIIFVQVALEVSRGPEGFEMTGWSYLFAASILVMLGYETDRRRGREDYGVWLHLAAAVCAVVVLISLFGTEKAFRHLLLPTAIASMTASLFLRRIVWMIVGLGILFSYLTWLAADVFKRAFAFPVILAVVGIAIIIVTVWVQRTYPRLAARVRERRGERPQFPGGSALLLAPALVAILVMPPVREAQRWEQTYARADAHRWHVINARAARNAKRARDKAAAQAHSELLPQQSPQG
jgi:hypothetical protein